MGVVKLSQSLKQVQFVSDEGVVYVTSVKYLLGLLNGGDSGRVLVMNVLPLRVAENRYPKSKVWSPELRDELGGFDGGSDPNRDASSSGFKRVKEKRDGFVDKVVF
jgi:hypothetical protein